MSRLVALYKSSLGKKTIVALTGAVMLGFLVGHVSGNLKVFLPDVDGRPDIDIYGEFLRSAGEPLLPHGFALWTARVGLLVSLILHVVCVVQLSRANRSARPIDYERRQYVATTPPTRWMMFTGVIVLVFVVYHVLHLTVGAIGPGKFEHGAVHQNLLQAFSSFLQVAIYLIAMLVVAVHLFHGTWSLFQTLGLDHPDRNLLLRRLSMVVSVALFIGFVSVPTALFVSALSNEALQAPSTQSQNAEDSQNTVRYRPTVPAGEVP